jgi:chromosome segregation ATPase
LIYVIGAKVERLVVENNVLKETIKSLESRDEENMATLQKENEELKKQKASLGTRESVLVAQNRAVKRLEVQRREAKSMSAHWEEQVGWFGFGMSALTLTGCFQAKTLQGVVMDKEKAVGELRNKLAAHDSPGGRSAREQQFEMRTAELRRSVEEGGDEARRLRQQVFAAVEKLKEREKQWESARERLTSSAGATEARLNGQIKELSEQCFQQGARNAQLAERNSPEMEQALRVSQQRVRTLERQVRELEEARGEQMGLAPYTVLLRMAECMNQMGKDMREVSRCKVVPTTGL